MVTYARFLCGIANRLNDQALMIMYTIPGLGLPPAEIIDRVFNVNLLTKI